MTSLSATAIGRVRFSIMSGWTAHDQAPLDQGTEISSRSAKTVRTRMPANTALTSNVDSACRSGGNHEAPIT
jgi:hypothetical protein